MFLAIISSAVRAHSGSMCATASDGHADLVAAHVGVERGVLDALLRDLAAEDQALDLLDLQQMVDGGLVEDRVAALGDERRVRVRQQRLDELRPAAVERGADQVVARALPVLVVVVDVDRQGVVGPRGAVAQLDHLRQLLRHRFGELLGVLMVVGIEHVDDDEGGASHLGRQPSARGWSGGIFASMQVRDAMTERVLTIAPDRSLREAARFMTEHNVGAAVIVDPGSPAPGSSPSATSCARSGRGRTPTAS